MNVLIVDDEQGIRDVIKEYIKSGNKYLNIYDLESQINNFIQIYK